MPPLSRRVVALSFAFTPVPFPVIRPTKASVTPYTVTFDCAMDTVLPVKASKAIANIHACFESLEVGSGGRDYPKRARKGSD